MSAFRTESNHFGPFPHTERHTDTLTVGNVLVQVPPLVHTTGTTEPAFEVFDGRGLGFCYFAPALAETIRSRFGFHRAMC
jgi:hypothetical protein